MFKKITDFARDMLGLLLAGLVFGAGLYGVLGLIKDAGTGREEGAAEVYKASAVSLPAVAEEVPEDAGVGRVEIYVEGDGEPPAWYRPDEPMAAVWTSEDGDDHIGWGGRRMEEWEMDLFSRIFYLEFWGASPECCAAGCDAILRLWESGYFSDTMGGTLSAVTENGALAYSTYAYVWDWTYDAEGLRWCRAFCEQRFKDGPEWIAPFFQKYGYPRWAKPCYELGGVFFSTFKEGTK